jgi:hypothetical protein
VDPLFELGGRFISKGECDYVVWSAASTTLADRAKQIYYPTGHYLGLS